MAEVVRFTLEADVAGATRGVDEFADAAERAGKASAKASSEASKLVESGTRTGRAMSSAGRATKEATAELKHLEDVTGEADSVMQGLASALDLVNPALADVVRGAGDLSGGIEAVARTGSGLAPILTGIAAAAGAVYLAFKAWNEESERSERIGKLVMEQQRKLKPLLDATRDATIDLRVASGELTDEQGTKLRAAVSAWGSYQAITEEARGRIAELKREQDGIITQLVDQVEAVSETNPRMALLAKLIDGVTTSSSEMQEEIDALNGVVRDAQAALSDVVDTQQEVIDTQTDTAEAAAGASGAVTKLGDSVMSLSAGPLRAAIERGEQYAQTLRRMSDAAVNVAAADIGLGQGGLQDVLSVLATSQDVGEVSAATDILAEVAREAERVNQSMAAAGDAFAEMEAALADATGSTGEFGNAMDALDMAASELERQARRQAGLEIGGNLLVGNAGGALAAAGPVGMAVAALGQIGAQGGAEGVVDALEETSQNIIDGLIALPELIIVRLPEFINRLALALAKAIIVELPAAIVDAFIQVFERLKQLIKDLFSLDGSAIKEAIGDFFTPSGSRATGGGIPVTGLYELHEGERVIPASGVTSATGRSSLARASRGGGPPIVIQAGVVTPSLEREVVEMVRRYLSPYGAGGTLEPVV